MKVRVKSITALAHNQPGPPDLPAAGTQTKMGPAGPEVSGADLFYTSE